MRPISFSRLPRVLSTGVKKAERRLEVQPLKVSAIKDRLNLESHIRSKNADLFRLRSVSCYRTESQQDGVSFLE